MQTRTFIVRRAKRIFSGLGLAAIAGVIAGSGVSCSSSKTRSPEEIAPVVDYTAERRSVSATLDTFHAAAAKADFATYTACFAPDLVFLGTDPKERWRNAEFTAFTKSYFDQGKGWTYTLVPGSRTVTVDQPQVATSQDGERMGGVVTTAWFDEMLENEKYGLCRGSGVMRKIGGRWLVSQYNLAFSVPNEVAEKVVQLNKSVVR